MNEPVRYGFLRDGLFVTGTLVEYADIWGRDVYDDGVTAVGVGLSENVITFDGEHTVGFHTVTVTRLESANHPDVKFTLSVNGESQAVLIPKDWLS